MVHLLNYGRNLQISCHNTKVCFYKHKNIQNYSKPFKSFNKNKKGNYNKSEKSWITNKVPVTQIKYNSSVYDKMIISIK